MKKILLIFITLIVVTLVSCGEDATTLAPTTTNQTTTSLTQYIMTLENEYNISLFVTEDLTTSMNINFEMPIDTTAYVEYSVLGTDFALQQEADQKIRYFNDDPVYLYEATMDNLTPGTTYEYRVHNEDNSLVSEYYTFKTMLDTDTSHTFMYLADPQENAEFGYMAYASAVYNAMDTADINFDLVMSPGDLVQDNDIKSEWDWFFQYSSLFCTSIPIAATLGNHEMKDLDDVDINSMEFDGYLNLPNNGPVYNVFDEISGDLRTSNFDDGKTYSFDYGLAHIVSINTEVYCDGTTSCSSYDQENGDILNAWLRNDLDNSDSLWTIVLLHRGPYSLSYDTTSVRDNLSPIFDDYDVDLVLFDHQYSRAIYSDDELITFARSDDYTLGTISLIAEDINNLDFNHYSSSNGVTYLTPNTTSTKFYGGSKSSGIDVNYGFQDSYPVIPFITITADSILVTSYVMMKDSAFDIVINEVDVLEEFTITK